MHSPGWVPVIQGVHVEAGPDGSDRDEGAEDVVGVPHPIPVCLVVALSGEKKKADREPRNETPDAMLFVRLLPTLFMRQYFLFWGPYGDIVYFQLDRLRV